MTTISLHSLTLLHIAFEARNRARIEATRPDALTTDSIVAIIMATTAAEAFINELPEYIRILKPSPNADTPITATMIACADALDEVEESNGSITLKYQIAALTLSGSTFQKGNPPFQEFDELVRLRNSIIHMKPAWSGKSHRGKKLAQILEQRGLTLDSEHGKHLPWFDRLMTPKVAEQACTAARNIMLAVLAFIPDTDPDSYSFKFIKDQLRSNDRFTS